MFLLAYNLFAWFLIDHFLLHSSNCSFLRAVPQVKLLLNNEHVVLWEQSQPEAEITFSTFVTSQTYENNFNFSIISGDCLDLFLDKQKYKKYCFVFLFKYNLHSDFFNTSITILLYLSNWLHSNIPTKIMNPSNFKSAALSVQVTWCFGLMPILPHIQEHVPTNKCSFSSTRLETSLFKFKRFIMPSGYLSGRQQMKMFSKSIHTSLIWNGGCNC